MITSLAGHVKLQQAPLKRVICQLRFPTILGFSASTMRPFQQAIEDSYPLIHVEKVIVGVAIMGADVNPTQVDIKDVFRFAVADGDTTVAVSEDFISLETTNYDRFTHFSERWEGLMTSALATLGVRHQARLGLRYTNIIERDTAADTIDTWTGVIQEHLLRPIQAISAPIGATAFAEQHVVRANTEHGGIVFRHGFPTPPEEQLPIGYMLDIDNYDDKPKTIAIPQHLVQLAQWDHQSYALLRASVSDAQWASFGPEGS